MDWDDVQHFLALARLGSVRAAGTCLGVSHSTVARRIEALEAELATRLFDRHRDGYVLTDAGRQMLAGAERIEGEIAALERGLSGLDDRLSGPVSVTCCDAFVAGMLIRELASFCERHPEIELHINTDARLFDLSKREADIAVRALGAGTAPAESLIAYELAPLMLANYVATAHEATLDPEREGTNPRWLSFEPRALHAALIARSSYPNLRAWGAFSSLEVAIAAARAGLGLVMLPTYVGDCDPTLRRLAHADLDPVGTLWMLSHPDLRDNARCRAVRASIADAFRKHASLFSGDGVATAHREVTKSHHARERE